jgi:hypothetical protein
MTTFIVDGTGTIATTVGNSPHLIGPHLIGTPMTEAAKTAAPPWAIRCWTDGLQLYAEIPGSPCYVMKLSLTDSGLHKALDLLRTRARAEMNGAYGKPAALPQPQITRKGPTPEQRKAAVEVLRKLGMV